MEPSTWGTPYASDTQMNGQYPGNTPGKSPYFVELDQTTTTSTQSHHTTPHQHDNSNYSTPGDTTSLKRHISGRNQMGSTPLNLNPTTPSNFTESEQMFLQELEQNMYEQQQQQHQQQQQQQQQQLQHRHPQQSQQQSKQQQQSHQHHHSFGGHDQMHSPHHNFRLDATIPSSQPLHHHMNLDHVNQEAQEVSFHHHDVNTSGHPNSGSSVSTPSGGVPILHSSRHSQSHTLPHAHAHAQAQAQAPPQQNLQSQQPQFEFGLENLNFSIPEELNFDTEPGHVSSAFPPDVPTEQTPSLLAINAMKKEEERKRDEFSSPILPGQNEKSYNKQHLYHRQNSQGKIYTVNLLENDPSSHPQHVRPDAIFTPLVSPAVTPLDKGANGSSLSSKAQSQQQQQPPANVNFEPLTSPALNAQTSDKRRTSSSMYGPSTSSEDHKQQHKRRTPHGTPILPASNKSYISPSVKAKSSTPTSNTDQLEKLPQSSLPEGKTESNDTDMLPPNGKLREINEPPLMGFTMGRLAGEGQLTKTKKQPRKKKNESRKSSVSKSSSSGDSSSASSSPKSNKKPEKLAVKKASHKIAEQGRRNRMNVGIADLASLIPQSYHDEVSIPSKATTVELASRYIRKLLGDIEDLKNGESLAGNEEETSGEQSNVTVQQEKVDDGNVLVQPEHQEKQDA
ncbi:PHO4 [Candida theae]|uniref:PHO4 n=1 Tax=Candida theae TaxID=1198502 RepID=A0AAD5BF02_9ASCO|nr:PHO4 [Candida theae]KAI5958588.1 PHO4 [Candida theae]